MLGLKQHSTAEGKASTTHASSSAAFASEGEDLIDPDTLHKYSSTMKGVRFEHYGGRSRTRGGSDAESAILVGGKYQATGNFNL